MEVTIAVVVVRLLLLSADVQDRHTSLKVLLKVLEKCNHFSGL